MSGQNHRNLKQYNMLRDVKNNKGFYKYIGQKIQAKETVPPLINGKRELATADMAEVLNEFFASIFTVNQASYVSHVPEPLGRGQRSGVPHSIIEEQVRLIVYESMRPDNMHLRVLMELSNVVAVPFSIIFEKS